MSGQHVAYIRVSSADQNTDRQLDGVAVARTFEDKASAKDMNRPQLAECLKYLREGDTLHVHSIDRLARNLGDLERLVDDLTGRGVAVQFHKEALTFSGADNPMQRLMLQMMGAFAQFERALIKERQREGIAQAKEKGKYLGRKPALDPQQVGTLRQRIANGENKAALARELGISRTALYDTLRRAA